AVTAIVEQGAAAGLTLMPPFHGLLSVRHLARNDCCAWMRAAIREGTQRSPVAPFEFPDLANCACLKQLLDPTVCRQPGYWPIHRKGDVSLLGSFRHAQRLVEPRRHWFFRDDVNPMPRYGLGDLCVLGVFSA